MKDSSLIIIKIVLVGCLIFSVYSLISYIYTSVTKYLDNRVDSAGKCYESVWRNDIIDNGRKNFLGVYPTEEACEQSIKDIKSKLGK